VTEGVVVFGWRAVWMRMFNPSRFLWAKFLAFSALLLFGACLSADARQSSGGPDASLATLSNSPIQMLSPDIFQVGKVVLNKRQRTVSFPAVLDKTEGLMEYFLVTTYGKTHESILKTEAEPYHIHLAMLLLGATGSPQNSTNGIPPPPGPIINPSTNALGGDKISVEVSWMVDGKEIHRPATDLISCQQTNFPPDPAQWVYNGSEIADGRFYAQLDGSLISLVTDPVALVNYTGPGHDNDQLWVSNTNTLPPRSAELKVTIKLAGTNSNPSHP
jgi:hypothetical protein